MIEINSLSKSFGKLDVLKNVKLTLNPNQSVALIGPNGCGKTTLIKSILGMVLPDSGEIKFDGHKIRNQFQYRNEIGYMPQIGHYPENMTIGHIIEIMKEIRNSSKELDEDLLHAFKLKNMFEKKMRTLSGGTTQKVSATLAFLFDPKVLILDEPTAGLDPLASEILKEKIIAGKQKGKIIMITSHLLSELDDMINGLIYMQDGQILLDSPIEEVKVNTGQDTVSKAISHILKTMQHA